MMRICIATRTALLLLPIALTGCGVMEPKDSAPRRPVDTSSVSEPVPRNEPRSRYGNPSSYVVNGREYRVLATSNGYVERGIASWYGTKFHGRRTSSGEAYDMYAMSAAHKTLPIPCYARVTNLENGRSVVVRINDRGPFHDNRLIDLSYAAANRIGINSKGTGLVEVRAVSSAEDTAPVMASSDNAATSSSASGPRLYLQVGAFASRGNAEQLHSRLTENLIRNSLVQEASRPEGPIYRVRIGPLSGVEQADALTLRITTLGLGTPQVVID
jgi:rare lipoprotein A